MSLPLLSSFAAATSACLFGYALIPRVRPALIGSEQHASFRDRLLARLDSVHVGPRLTAWASRRNLDALVAAAGWSRVWTAERVLRLQMLAFATAGAASLAIGLISLPFRTKLLWIAVLIVCARWWILSVLRQRTVARRRQLQRGLADVLDLLRLQIHAGAGIEQACRTLAANATGAWRPIFTRLAFTMDHGIALDAALTASAADGMLDDWHRCVLAIRQAQQLGASLADTLTIQAETLRTRRRQRAEERARLAAIKIALPLVFCIFPALLIIYLAPAVLRVAELFG